MGRAYSTNWGNGMHIGYWCGSQKEGYHWEDQYVGGWTILKWILETGRDSMKCTDLAQDKGQ
jgi:hypothetical protein